MKGRYDVGEGDSFGFEHHAPTSNNGRTFVCFNALSGDQSMWLQTIWPKLRDAGHGLLIWNFRGQPDTEFTFSETREADIINDAVALIRQEKPVRPVYVGLSIGGLFAIRVHEAGDETRADAIVLINTLRRAGPRLDWINNAVARVVEVGGPDLMKDLYMPLLMNEDWQSENRGSFLQAETYTPPAKGDGTLMLLKAGINADWSINYEALDLPVLVITGMQDRVFRDPADVRALFERLPNARGIDVEDAGHMIPVERPERLANALLKFALIR